MLSRNRKMPIAFKSTPNRFIISRIGIIKLLVKILKAIDTIEKRNILLLLYKIFNYTIFLFLLFLSLISRNSLTISRDLSVVLPNLFDSESNNKPTPEIKTIGEILDCKNLTNESIGSILFSNSKLI